ncbi:MAG: RNA polymerase sigma factor [Christensenellales bacterium]
MPSDTQRDCFLQAVEERKHSMYRVALMMLRRPADAEDAVSDAVEAAWRRLHGIRDLEALPAYLMRSTINACHAVLRKRRRGNHHGRLGTIPAPLYGRKPRYGCTWAT